MPKKKDNTPKTRLERVRDEMAAHGLTQLLVSDPTTIFYLTGLRLDPGERMYCLLFSADGSVRLFVNRLFGQDCVIRFRPHHFPYTEPSAEVDVQCFKCGGTNVDVNPHYL